jgi:hypothetical protein
MFYVGKAALQETRGLTTLAARRLGCTRGTVENYVARYPIVRLALHDARARQLDVAEAQLFKAIDNGELRAVESFLKTIGRHRGYGDRLEVDATVDLLQAPEWLRTRTLLLEVLRAYPEAQLAVVSRLRALEASQDTEAGDAEAAG